MKLIESGNYLITFLDLFSTSRRFKAGNTKQDIIDLSYMLFASEKQENRQGINVFIFSDNVAVCLKIEDESMLEVFLQNLCSYVCRYLWMNLSVLSGKVNVAEGFIVPIRWVLYRSI